MKLSEDNKYYETKLWTLNTEKSKSLESAENFDKKNERNRKKNTLSLLRKTEEAYKNNKIKSLIDFEEYVSSVKSLAIKKGTKVNITTRFLNGKMLMFSKTSIQSFI